MKKEWTKEEACKILIEKFDCKKEDLEEGPFAIHCEDFMVESLEMLFNHFKVSFIKGTDDTADLKDFFEVKTVEEFAQILEIWNFTENALNSYIKEHEQENQ